MKELIELEIKKENPDWLQISKWAKKIHESELETNPLLFKKGILNIIKVGEYDTRDFYQELVTCFSGDEYHYFASDDVREFNKWISSKPDLSDKYHIFITAKPSIITNSLSSGYECNFYKGGVRFKYDKDKPTTFILKSDDIDIKFHKECLRQEIRNIALSNLLD